MPALPRHARPIHWLLIFFALLSTVTPVVRAAYTDIPAMFETIYDDTIFPVAGKTFDDVEETFGPRRQPSLSGAYDWHRGIDLDGVGGEDILAAYDGTFVKLDYSASAGNYVVLKHTFAPSITYGPNPDKQTWTNFYTYYLHLDDEVTTRVSNNNWTSGSVISAGTHIGEMGNTGASGGEDYAYHLHFELRFGTSNPLSNQIDGDGLTITDAWFDPHMHPLLLYNPNRADLRGASLSTTYTQTLTQMPANTIAGARTFLYTSSLDELPMPNEFTVAVRPAGGGGDVLTYTLDFNQRTGYDADTNAALDTQDTTKPYMAPEFFEDAASTYTTKFVVPDSWLGSYANDPNYELYITASDIWLNQTSLTVAAVPEPATTAITLGALVLGYAAIRRRIRL